MDTKQTGGQPGMGNMPNLYWVYGVTVAVLFVLVVAEVILLPHHCKGVDGGLKNSVGMAVLVAGMLGGFVSSITRGIKDPMLALSAPRGVLVAQKAAHVLLGGIFSIVLYLMFAGGMLSGSLFPHFPKDAVTSFTEFLCNARPETIPDYARALVWGFLAGYSQTLMPNLFDKLIEAVKVGDGGKDDQKDTHSTKQEGKDSASGKADGNKTGKQGKQVQGGGTPADTKPETSGT